MINLCASVISPMDRTAPAMVRKARFSTEAFWVVAPRGRCGLGSTSFAGVRDAPACPLSEATLFDHPDTLSRGDPVQHGIGRVFKRKGSRFWWIEMPVKGHPGKPIRESSKSTRKADAEALRTRRLEESRLVPGLVRKLRTGEVLDAYLEDAKVRALRDLGGIGRALERARPLLGAELAGDVDPRHLYEYQQGLRTRLKPATVNVSVSYLRAAFKHAERNGLIARCPAFPRKLPERNARKGFIEHADYLAIVGELPEWARDPFSFAYYSGWRRNEVVGLLWEEVDFEQRAVLLSRDRDKTGEPRRLPFAVGEVGAIIERRKGRRVLGLPTVFHHHQRRVHPSTFNVTFRKACIAAGRGSILIHDCRRTAVRNLIRSGIPENQAMKITGHRSSYVFRRYDIVDVRDLELVAEKYTAFMREKAAEAEARVLPFAKGEKV